MKNITRLKLVLVCGLFVGIFSIKSVSAQTATPTPEEFTNVILTSIDTLYNIYNGHLTTTPPDLVINSKRPMFRGGATAGTQIKVAEINGTEICTAITGSNGKWECQPANDFTKNGISIEIWAKINFDYVKRVNFYLIIEQKNTSTPKPTTNPTTLTSPMVSQTLASTETPTPTATQQLNIDDSKIDITYSPEYIQRISIGFILGMIFGIVVTLLSVAAFIVIRKKVVPAIKKDTK